MKRLILLMLCCWVFLHAEFELTSPAILEVDPGEFIYISGLSKEVEDVRLQCPENWKVVSGFVPGTVQIFCVKVPQEALAGEYEIAIAAQTIRVKVLPKEDFSARVENIQSSYLPDDPIHLNLVCLNRGNISMTIQVEVTSDPICDLECSDECLEIQPSDLISIPLHVKPKANFEIERQFVLLKVNDVKTGKYIYQTTLNLNVVLPGASEDDMYVRIPSAVSAMVLGDSSSTAFAVKWEGGGIIDPTRDRYLEFLFLIPTKNNNVIYSSDQVLYLAMSEPTWDFQIGDSIYNLTQLSQNYVYGRGIELDLYGDVWSVGAHYNQDSCDRSPNLKETCGYIEYAPTPIFSMSGNYLHKNQKDFCDANIATLLTDFEFPSKVFTEIEIANNFVKETKLRNSGAYRIETQGKCGNDTWFGIEQVGAGSKFNGSYENVDSTSAIIDFPIRNLVRGNLSYTRLRQNFINYCSNEGTLEPRQYQINGNLNYNMICGGILGLNAFILRAKDVGKREQFNFLQKWIGASFSRNLRDYIFNSRIAFGAQNDFLLHHSVDNLKSFYFFLGKNFTQNWRGAIFYDGGNTNYYDPKPWRDTFGVSTQFRYGSGSYLDLYVRNVKTSPNKFNFLEWGVNYVHFFKNRHQIQLAAQNIRYRSSIKDDFQFFLSYTIPLSLPVGKRKDVGSVSGYVYDDYERKAVPFATINLNGKKAVTDAEGYFNFSSTPVGMHALKTENLPQNLLAQYEISQNINVLGGKKVEVPISVVQACSIKGTIKLYVFDDTIPPWEESEPHIIEKEVVAGLRIFISSENGKEVYTTISDREGSFEFAMLRPGKWTISINNNQIASSHFLEEKELILNVKPKEDKVVNLRVLPKTHKIKRFQ